MSLLLLQNPGRGYPVNFVEPPPKEIPVKCAICSYVFFQPKTVSCCGHRFCAACISLVERDHKPCPHCGQEFSLVDDKRLERTLNDCKVYCPHQEKGCKWIGELGELPRHLNQDPKSDKLLVGCVFQEIRCGLCHLHSCERRLMDEHVFAQCPNREIECEYRYAGCDVKTLQQQLESHNKEAVSLQLSLVTNFVQDNLSQKDNEIQQLKDEVSQQRKQIRELRRERHINHNQYWIVLLLLGGIVHAYMYQQNYSSLELSSKIENLTFQYTANGKGTILCIHMSVLIFSLFFNSFFVFI